MWLNNKYVHGSLALLILLAMAAAAAALWRGLISVEWLASFGYKGIFLISLINSVSPIAGPSQIATFLVASKLNPLLVGVAGGVGGAIGEVTGYLFGRFFRASLSDKFKRKFDRFRNWRVIRVSRERSFVPLFVLASIPNPFFDPVSAVAGSLRIAFVKYFVPVLLGRTLRHVVIAYAGYYTITRNVGAVSHSLISMTVIDSVVFVAAILGIAFFAWLVRSFAEAEPDPLLLNFTFFAFAGQCVLTLELMGEGKSLDLIKLVWLLDLLAFILVIIQVRIVMAHASTTIEHYEKVLRENKADEKQVEHWATILFRITGADFFPEFYQKYINIRFLRNSRDRQRQQAVSILPLELFTENRHEITAKKLTIDADERKWPWRLYAYVCLAAWILFIICSVVGRKHQ